MGAKYIIQCLLLPPGLFISLAIISLLLYFFSRNTARLLLTLSILGWYILSIPYTPVDLAKPLQNYPALRPSMLKHQQHAAIVVLSAGRYFNAPEYGGDTASTISLMRLRYAAKLHKETGIPILISGGAQSFGAIPDAQLMEQALIEGFHIHAKWLDKRSANTWQNAVYSTNILKKDQIKTILLVTSAIHMKRAVLAFSQSDLHIIPAPTYFIQKPNLGHSIYTFLPNRFAFFTSTQCLYEYLGILWYHLHHHQSNGND